MNKEEKNHGIWHGPGKIKIRSAISVVFCALLVLSTLITTSYTYFNIQTVIDGTARDLINKTQNAIINEIMAYLKPPMNLSLVGGVIYKTTGGDTLDNKILVDYMLEVLKVYPQSSLVYASDIDGNYTAVGNLSEKRVFAFDPARPLPRNAVFYQEIVDRRNGQLKNIMRYLDAHGQIMAQEENPVVGKDTYDPRRRDWFKRTQSLGQPNWSEVYLGYNTTDFMISAAAPVMDDQGRFTGVVAVDVPLKRIGDMLAQQKASRSGINFIINNKGEVISFPDKGRNILYIDGIPSIKHLKDMNEPALIKAYDHYQTNHRTQFSFSHDDIDFYGHFMNFPNDFASPWVLAMVAPMDDFVGPIKETSQDVIIIALMILAVSTIFLIVFSHKISYPIEMLADQMHRIKNLDIDGDEPSDSSLQEIAKMEEALALMKDGLGAFSKFVPKELVRSLVTGGHVAQLGGERKNLAIMFSDIASFTSISENMESDKLMVHLSDYLNRLSHIILKNRGTIDKYIGDAIMAFWGAPIEDEHRIYNACHAVLLCSRHLDRLNAEWQKLGRVPLPTRFGLHYGEVIVGNVGSYDRLNYTVIGDSVNLASRLEGTNKAYGTHVIVSETIEQAVGDRFLMRPLDIVAVKGKEKGVRIFELMAEHGQDKELMPIHNQSKIATLTREAFECYLQRDWPSALALYKTANRIEPSDQVSILYIERCEEYIKTPPPENWDGVYHLKTK